MDSFQRERLLPDMFFEVISRTSLQTLGACKAVSAEWKQLISTSTFTSSYCKNTGNVVGYIIQGLVKNKYLHKFVSPYKSERSFNFSPLNSHDIKIQASSPQGILCCVRNIGRECRYYVSKPCANQWQPLPNPKRPHSTAKVALVVMSSSPLHYKIFRISEPRFSKRLDCNNYRCQVFDSRIWAWKEAEDVLLSTENHFDGNPAVYASGFVCFLTDDYVLGFCLDQETPVTVSLPQSIVNADRKKIIEYQGKLGLICEISGNVELWELKDWRSRRWEMINRLNTDVLAMETSNFPSPEGFLNSEIALMKTYGGVLFWDLLDFSSNEIQLQYLAFVRDIFPFSSDWEPVKLRTDVKPTGIDMAVAEKNSSKSRLHWWLPIFICFCCCLMAFRFSSYIF